MFCVRKRPLFPKRTTTPKKGATIFPDNEKREIASSTPQNTGLPVQRMIYLENSTEPVTQSQDLPRELYELLEKYQSRSQSIDEKDLPYIKKLQLLLTSREVVRFPAKVTWTQAKEIIDRNQWAEGHGYSELKARFKPGDIIEGEYAREHFEELVAEKFPAMKRACLNDYLAWMDILPSTVKDPEKLIGRLKGIIHGQERLDKMQFAGYIVTLWNRRKINMTNGKDFNTYRFHALNFILRKGSHLFFELSNIDEGLVVKSIREGAENRYPPSFGESLLHYIYEEGYVNNSFPSENIYYSLYGKPCEAPWLMHPGLWAFAEKKRVRRDTEAFEDIGWKEVSSAVASEKSKREHAPTREEGAEYSLFDSGLLGDLMYMPVSVLGMPEVWERSSWFDYYPEEKTVSADKSADSKSPDGASAIEKIRPRTAEEGRRDAVRFARSLDQSDLFGLHPRSKKGQDEEKDDDGL
ncbi:MAG: hypothetical protein MI784_06790 [Cytophagales bacterium]|nr:hypothetical protein [Cytophagales bacterium]